MPELHANGHHTNHTVVTDPNQLFSVNQQQHIQHQLMIHQQQTNHQRRRSSIHQSVIQHAPAQPNGSQQQQRQPQPDEDIAQDVTVEITEVKP